MRRGQMSKQTKEGPMKKGKCDQYQSSPRKQMAMGKKKPK